MTKNEFIDKLKAALSGKVSNGTVQENAVYYEQYFNGEIAKGRSEEEICESLGSPQLIAKGILEAEKYQCNSGGYRAAYEEEMTDHGQADADGGYQSDHRRVRSYQMPGWLMLIIAVFIIAAVFWIIVTVFSALAPILIPVCVVLILWRFIRENFM